MAQQLKAVCRHHARKSLPILKGQVIFLSVFAGLVPIDRVQNPVLGISKAAADMDLQRAHIVVPLAVSTS